jgi:hypothetical protein
LTSDPEIIMEIEATTNNTPKMNQWANASLISSLVAYVLALLSFLLGVGPALCCAFPCWIASLVFGVVAFVEIRTKRPAFKGKRQAIIGICASAIPLIITIAIGWMVYSALRGEPYDESHPEVVISIIEKNCDIEFPAKMESLKAADRIAPGIDKPYHFVVSFTTNMNNFAELKESISQLDSYFEERVERDPNIGKYTPADFALLRDSPEWYKTEIPKCEIHESSGVSKNNKIRLRTIWIDLPESEKVVVYMEGWGDSRLKQDKK